MIKLSQPKKIVDHKNQTKKNCQSSLFFREFRITKELNSKNVSYNHEGFAKGVTIP